MGRMFGTDGVRGVANEELTAEVAFNIGKAAAYVLGKRSKRPIFVIGKDTRISGDMLENALTAGILSVGGNVMKLGVIPTPAVAYLVRYFKADAGVVISASHNPFEYNGIKFFNSEGFKLDDNIENEIEDVIYNGIKDDKVLIAKDIGRCIDAKEDSLKIYTDFLLSTIDKKLDGIKIVLDLANGASYKSARIVFDTLGANLYVLSDDPNGVNINDNCGSTHPENLQKRVVELSADIGLSFDGDADRLIVVDDKGRIVDGDYILSICAKKLKDDGELNENRITASVMSNIGLHRKMAEYDIEVDTTKVGDKYILESMLKTGSVLGGEQSGHMIFLNYATAGDGVMSALQFIKAYISSGKKVSELRDEITIYPQVLVNAKVKNEKKDSVRENQEINNRIKEIEELIGDTGRVLIRPSGTEPLVRVMLEGEDIETLNEYANELAKMIEEKLGNN